MRGKQRSERVAQTRLAVSKHVTAVLSAAQTIAASKQASRHVT